MDKHRMSWPPNITVASVVFREDRYLLVKERDKEKGKPVYNQPAGHLEPGETLVDAAVRETLEETTWKISILALLGITLFKSLSGKTYLRHTFLAKPIERDETAKLDRNIISTHWLNFEDIKALSEQLRTPIVFESIKWHKSGVAYPIDLFK